MIFETGQITRIHCHCWEEHLTTSQRVAITFQFAKLCFRKFGKFYRRSYGGRQNVCLHTNVCKILRTLQNCIFTIHSPALYIDHCRPALDPPSRNVTGGCCVTGSKIFVTVIVIFEAEHVTRFHRHCRKEHFTLSPSLIARTFFLWGMVLWWQAKCTSPYKRL